jgi:uncharacterized caspase-like protein
MNRHASAILTLVLLGALLCAAPLDAQQRNRGVKVKTKSDAARFDGSVYDNLWAVVIGIDRYQQWDRLEYAVNDAKSVRSLLIGTFGFHPDRVIELLDKDATLVNIRTTLGGVLPQKTRKNDGVLVFFAGHGETVDLPDGGNLGYLVPVDGSTEKSEYFATLLPMTQLREICTLIPAKHVFFVVDACYSGLAAASERGMSNDTRQYVSKLASMKSRQVLTAGGRGEPVVEKAEWGHSAFTYKLLEGLETGAADSDQDGVITSGEIATYIKTRVPKITGNKQTPQFKNLSNDEGEFVFLFNQSSRKSKSNAGAEPAGAETSDALRKELERVKKEMEELKQQKDTPSDTKKAEKKNDEIFTPPP